MKENKVAIYVRVSTTKESQKDSPEHQLAACHAYAQEHGLEVVRVYEDRDSGTSIMGRPDVQRMVKEAQTGAFGVILFSSLSRFSRDVLDSISLKRMIVNALSIRLISIEDFFDSAKEDNEMLFGIVSVVNQKLSEQTSTASKRGIRQSAIRGNYTGSIAPYGYKKAVIDNRKTLVIDHERAEIVKMIFDMYVNRKMGEKAIVNSLNGSDGMEPVPSYKGGVWGITSVQRILQNEAYTGENVFGKYETAKIYNDLNNMSDRKKKLVQRKKETWERSTTKTHEAIVSDEIFQRAQEIRLIRGGGQRGGRKAYVNVFAKMVFCEHCGSAMVTMKSGKKNKEYRYLMCSKRRRQGEAGCANGNWIPYQPFRDEVISWVVTKLRSLIDPKKGTDELLKKISVSSHDYEKDISRYKKAIEDNRRLLFAIRRQHMLEEISPEQYEFEKEQYETEINLLTNRLTQAQHDHEQQQDTTALRKEISAAVEELLQLENYEDTDKVRLILSRLIKRVNIDSEGQVDVFTPLGQLDAVK
ncbi:recombinase family protein [Gorillibacterium sp. sgz5001074]|uniref:recombinase family protein n=1 Tax=Gorillibacterium sp. sgz5001074 TaxID=3446695 RepID=UPI003F66F87D